MPRLFEQTDENSPLTDFRIAFGKALTATYNMTFANLFAYLRTNLTASETDKGVLEIATQTETDTGTDDTRTLTPAKLANSIYVSGITTYLSIGDWDMNISASGSASIVLAHGISDHTKIRSVKAMINVDSDAPAAGTIYDFTRPGDVVNSDGQGGGISVTASNVILVISLGSFFDSSVFDLTPFNRGYIKIESIP
jgi:hypothetical protein